MSLPKNSLTPEFWQGRASSSPLNLKPEDIIGLREALASVTDEIEEEPDIDPSFWLIEYK